MYLPTYYLLENREPIKPVATANMAMSKSNLHTTMYEYYRVFNPIYLAVWNTLFFRNNSF